MLPWQRNFRQNRLQLGLYKRYLRDPCAYHGVFEVGLTNDVRKIPSRATPVAMATKFDTKSTVTQLVYCRDSCAYQGVWGRAIELRQTNSTTTDPCCHGNEISHKIDCNSACIRDIAEIFAPIRGFSGSGY